MYDVVIIGAGVVGASAAYFLTKYNLNVAILEANNDVACGTTKANAAIVHAGYDALPGSLMAKYNVQGSKMMEEICTKLDVAYKRNGSIVLAFDDEDKERIRKLDVVSNDEDAIWLIDYWCSKDIKGLIKMPLSRHWIMHIEAANRIKEKILQS